MNSAVEFIDPPPEDPNPDGRGRRRYQELVGWARRQLGAGIARNTALLSWLAAAVLTVVATFQTVFTYRFDGTGIHTRGGFAASGRSLDPILSSEHGPRYAELFTVCAAWFAGVALLVVVERKGWVQWLAGRYVTGLAAAGTFLLVGSVAALGLDLEATHSSYSSLAHSLDQDSLGIVFRWHTGPCLWWVLAALAAAVVGLVATFRVSARPTTPPLWPDAAPVESAAPAAPADSPATDSAELSTDVSEAPEEELVLRRRAKGSR